MYIFGSAVYVYVVVPPMSMVVVSAPVIHSLTPSAPSGMGGTVIIAARGASFIMMLFGASGAS